MQVRVLKLGTVCRDKATDLEGTLTHWLMGMDKGINYFFQPKGLDEDSQPVEKLYLEKDRLNVKETDFEIVDVPFEILGTAVTSKSSGFTGMAIQFLYSINGCFHVFIQPSGLSAKTKTAIKKHDFDLRDCTGKKITELSERELKDSRQQKPSPTGGVLPQPELPTSFTRRLIP